MDDTSNTSGASQGAALEEGENTGLDALASSAPDKEPIIDASDADKDPAPVGDAAKAKTLIVELEDDIKAGIKKVEDLAEEGLDKVKDALGIKHGTHDAAVSGLQTDASGAYTPPVNPLNN